MGIMQKSTLLPLLVLTSAVTLAACGQQEITGTPAPSSPQAPSSSSPTASASPSPSETADLVTWDDNANVSHLFFHSLVADPERAFDGDEDSAGYLDYMVTIDEFNEIIQQVYDRDYILVSPHDLYTTNSDGSVENKPLELPEGKKPLVLSFDDLSYYEYMEGDGFADRLVLEGDEVLHEYTDANGETHTGDYDFVSLLDKFVEENPDFSHNGAKGVVALTGYNGIFGYRTSDLAYAETNDDIAQDKETAQDIADAMKDSGWEFATHSWGHINYTSSPLSFIQEDHKKWQREVEPLIGETDLLIYPFGADIAGVEDYGGEKFSYLNDQGVNAFFGIDTSVPAWGQLEPDYLRQARINVDGISLKNAIEGKSETVSEFFDPASVLDEQRPDTISGTS